ncbi:MAG: type I methionyl aminopeptidase [Candidatus Gracilibacteria bacterium]|nr:type I methionyl aminopeptidase [Candidatus Gracilibacteria bacterium]MDQ7022487.1 type I methionyl aminopeptidase [Candidatus Gracilibacteria bacterium]
MKILNKKEVQIMRDNAKVHKLVFEEIRKILKEGTTAIQVNQLCGKIAKDHNVLCGFKGVYDFPDNICISVNEVAVHGRARKGLVFKDGDLVTFDFGIKDKKVGINTDSAFSTIVGGKDKNIEGARLIQANKNALYAGIAQCKVGNRVGDISAAIQKEIEKEGFHVVKDLTGHAIGYKLHDKPYIPNHGTAGRGAILKEGMTLAIEPILGQTSGKISDKGDWEISIADGSLGSQYEHTILITDGDAEIII